MDVDVTEIHDDIGKWNRELEASRAIDSPEIGERRDYLKDQVRKAYMYLTYLEVQN